MIINVCNLNKLNRNEIKITRVFFGEELSFITKDSYGYTYFKYKSKKTGSEEIIKLHGFELIEVEPLTDKSVVDLFNLTKGVEITPNDFKDFVKYCESKEIKDPLKEISFKNKISELFFDKTNTIIKIAPETLKMERLLKEFLNKKEENMPEKETKGGIFSLNKEKIAFNADEYDVETKENGQIVLTPKLPEGEFSAEKLNDSHIGKEFWLKVRYERAMDGHKSFFIVNKNGAVTESHFSACNQLIKTAD